MVGSIFRNISKNSYYKSIYLHLSILLFVIIPLSYFVPQYLANKFSNSACEFTIVGTNGPSLKGPMNAAPMSATPCCKNERSFSFVNTPGDTIFYANLYALI
jgi:hypothetical protein